VNNDETSFPTVIAAITFLTASFLLSCKPHSEAQTSEIVETTVCLLKTKVKQETGVA